MSIKVIFIAIFTLIVLILLILRLIDQRADKQEWRRLLAYQPAKPANYDPKMVAYLPEPAQRFFNFAIQTGTPLLTVAEIDMKGEFSLGSREKPNYQKMMAKQILAAPKGFVWQMSLPGRVRISGSDSGKWTRFRLFELLPLARMGGDFDHALASFGRYVAEALFWTPAALLPSPGIVWETVNKDIARVTVTHTGLSQSVDVKVDDNGQPSEVSFMRWSNANPQKIHRLQPFGGKLSDFRDVQGFRLPFTVDAANMYGTDEEFVFFKARLNSVTFPK